jgi:hypothetical protein
MPKKPNTEISNTLKSTSTLIAVDAEIKKSELTFMSTPMDVEILHPTSTSQQMDAETYVESTLRAKTCMSKSTPEMT